jgi:acetyltransferase-like isoleucine patch superfamily enzyme
MAGIYSTIVSGFYMKRLSLLTVIFWSMVEGIYTDCLLPQCRSFGPYSYYGSLSVTHFGEPYHFSIGKFCSIGERLRIYLGGNHRTDWFSTFPFMSFHDVFPEAKYIQGHPVSNGDIIIGNDVWIGDDVTIMSGVTIGDGAVIGTQAVVAKNVPPYAIFVGNPARLARYRFDDAIIKRLLELRWWDWPLERIRKNVYFLCSSNISELLTID